MLFPTDPRRPRGLKRQRTYRVRTVARELTNGVLDARAVRC
jgi:hypothetical protein